MKHITSIRKAVCTMTENRQEWLKFLQQFPVEVLNVILERETETRFDSKSFRKEHESLYNQ